MKSRIGAYVRVSTTDKSQTTKSQKHAIAQWAKSNHINPKEIKYFEDSISGETQERPALTKLLWSIDHKRIDTLVVFRLDRLARNTRQGLELLANFGEKGIRVVSVSENIDFSNSTGHLIASILLSVASFERSILRERVTAGMSAARASGIHIGRPRNPSKYQQVKAMRNKGLSVLEIADKLQIKRQSVYYLLKQSA